MESYVAGNTIRFTGTFKDAAGNLVDPIGVYFIIKQGMVEKKYQYGQDSEVSRLTAGTYTCDVLLDRKGVVTARVYSTGASPLPAADEMQIEIEQSAMRKIR